ncbi:MAG TPA: hypothetical protein VGI77_02070, partial [Gaiellaceae bacterium]
MEASDGREPSPASAESPPGDPSPGRPGVGGAPPPDGPCSIGAGVLTVSNSTAHASAVVQGCSKTDLLLTLAAYRHGGTSFQLLASATLYPVSDGTASQVLQLPSCSTDVVLIRGS